MLNVCASKKGIMSRIDYESYIHSKKHVNKIFFVLCIHFFSPRLVAGHDERNHVEITRHFNYHSERYNDAE